MTRKHGLQPGGGLLFAGVIAGLLFFYSQKSMPVTAGESDSAANTGAATEARLDDGKPQTRLPWTTMQLGGHQYRLEVPRNSKQQQKGLMYRTQLAPGQGVLFRFKPAQEVSFWMKNTKIPLDMVFLRDQQVVHFIENVEPCKADPCPTYPSLQQVDSVVELPAGTVRKDGIRIGNMAVLGKIAKQLSREDR